MSFTTFVSRIKKTWQQEAKLAPEVRKTMTWQFTYVRSGTTYVVGKTDANTFFYSIGGGELKALMPEDMFNLLDTWTKQSYVKYVLRNPKTKKSKSSIDLESLLKKSGPKFVGCHIFGIKEDGTKKKLYSNLPTLQGNKWEKIK